MRTDRLAASLSVVVGLALPACESHTGPSEGVTVFEHPDFQGSSHTIEGNTFDFDDLRGPCGETTTRSGDWDNCISSIRISPGWEAVFYEHDEYEGETLTVTSDIADLDRVRGPCGDDWDDCVSSVRVTRMP